MLEQKGIAYKRVDLMPVVRKGVLKAMRFPGTTIPVAEDRRPQDHRARARSRKALDRDPARPAALPRRPRGAGRRRGGGALGRRRSCRRRSAGCSGTPSSATAAPLTSYAKGARLGVPIRRRGRDRARRSSPPSSGYTAYRRRASARTSPRLPGLARPGRRVDRRGRAGRRAAERRRLPDRRRPAPGDDASRTSARRSRARPGRRAGDARSSRTIRATRRRSFPRSGSSRCRRPATA